MKTFLSIAMTLFLAGCSSAESRNSPSTSPEAPEPPVVRSELLETREPTFVPSDYVARVETYRLLGIEPGDGIVPPSAIVADTKTWATRVLHEGDTLGRSARVTELRSDDLVLEGARGERRLFARGHDLSLRVARHRLDVATTALGRHRRRVDTPAARALLAARGAGARVEMRELWNQPALALTSLEPGGLLAESGLRELDLLLTIDGEPVTETSADTLAERLPTGVRVRIARGGTPMDLVFEP